MRAPRRSLTAQISSGHRWRLSCLWLGSGVAVELQLARELREGAEMVMIANPCAAAATTGAGALDSAASRCARRVGLQLGILHLVPFSTRSAASSLPPSTFELSPADAPSGRSIEVD